MADTLEDRFQRFLDQMPGSEKIVPGRPGVTEGEREADYFLDGGRVVAEIKSLKEPQAHKGEAVVDDYLDQTGAIVFGTLPLSRVAESEQHLAALEKTISRRMTRGIERNCREANKQIGAEFARLPHLATGLLILINEKLIDLHPRDVTERVLDFARSRITNIHYCLLIFESHRVNVNGTMLPYPLLLDLTSTARQRRARPFLEKLRDDWAKRNGFPDGLPDPESAEIAFLPDSLTLGR